MTTPTSTNMRPAPRQRSVLYLANMLAKARNCKQCITTTTAFMDLPPELRLQIYENIVPTNQTIAFRPVWPINDADLDDATANPGGRPEPRRAARLFLRYVFQPVYVWEHPAKDATLAYLVEPRGGACGITNLLRLNKIIYDEVTTILYEKNIFRFHATRVETFEFSKDGYPLDMESLCLSARPIPMSVFQNITKCQIVLENNYFMYTDKEDSSNWLKTLTRDIATKLGTQHHLKSLEVLLHHFDYGYASTTLAAPRGPMEDMVDFVTEAAKIVRLDKPSGESCQDILLALGGVRGVEKVRIHNVAEWFATCMEGMMEGKEDGGEMGGEMDLEGLMQWNIGSLWEED